MGKWLIYGAYGYNGRLIAEKAKAAGLQPVLAGRNAEKLATVARGLRLETIAFGLEDGEAIRQALNDVDLVLHCAGPYSHTAAPMLEACIDTTTHYLDISGEIDSFRLVFDEFSHLAESAGILLVPGVGFDVVPTDCLAAKIKDRLPALQSLEFGLDARLVPGPAAVQSMLEGIRAGNRVRENGQLREVEPAYKFKKIPFRSGEKQGMSIPWGDVITAWHSTGADDIIVYLALPVDLQKMGSFINLSAPVLRSTGVQNFLKETAARFIHGESSEKRAGVTAAVWVQGRDEAGQTVTLEAETPHPIEHTADAALAVVRRVLNSPGKKGAYTPSLLCGGELLDTLPGVTVYEM